MAIYYHEPTIILLGQPTAGVSLFGQAYGLTGAAGPRGRDAPGADCGHKKTPSGRSLTGGNLVNTERSGGQGWEHHERAAMVRIQFPIGKQRAARIDPLHFSEMMQHPRRVTHIDMVIAHH